MELRRASRLGRELSVVGLGTWQLGADWGEVSDEVATSVLTAAVDAGVTVLDTADVYGDGRSEQTIGRFLHTQPDITVFTKMGRRVAQEPRNYTAEHFDQWTARSLKNLGVDSLDLVQLHCPPTAVFDDDHVFDALDALVERGRIRAYGVSVETCEQALKAIARPTVASVQIILNAFRHKPLDEVLPAARHAGVAIIARVPLASGLLSGRFDRSTTFAEGDHRRFNRNGEAFDVGETFSGVPYDVGVDAAREFSDIAASLGLAPAGLALRWVLDQDGVTTVIPGASSPGQAAGNAAAATLEPLSAATLGAIRDLYDSRIRDLVHDRW